MNKERILLLAAHIEKQPEINMDIYHECETPMCVAGWAVKLWGDWEKAKEYHANGKDGFQTQAAKILDLDDKEPAGHDGLEESTLADLVCNNDLAFDYETPAQVGEMLRTLAETEKFVGPN